MKKNNDENKTDIDRIRDWFERHRDDYCDCRDAVPKVWSEYMAQLLTACGAPPTAPGRRPGQ